MNNRQHSALARRLITACGGLDEAAANCRVSRTLLSHYQNPHQTVTMPIDVVADLESYCGAGICSHALAEAAHGPAPSLDVFGDALDVNEALSRLLSDLNTRASDGLLCEEDRAALTERVVQIDEQLEAVKAALAQSERVRLVGGSGK